MLDRHGTDTGAADDIESAKSTLENGARFSSGLRLFLCGSTLVQCKKRRSYYILI